MTTYKKIKIKLSCVLAVTVTSFLMSACSDTPPTVETSEIVSKAATQEKQNHRLTATDLPHYLHRDIQDEVFYFVMPDRFYNGDTSNDNGSKTQAISAGGFDKADKGMYHGGDIQGLQAKIPYLKELGVSAIWLTPILRNQAVQGDSAGYHGYWVLDFTEIDPHLGSNEDLKLLIDSAHQANIKVFFDIITNHTADIIRYTDCHGEDGLQWLVENGCPYKSLSQIAAGDSYKTVIPKGLENIKSPAWLNNIDYYHNQGDSSFKGENSLYGDFAGLDDVNTNNAEVVEHMINTFSDLITEFKPDGFRIDTVKHVNIEFWSAFAPALVSHAKSIGIPQFFMFGEVYSFDSKELSQFTTEGKMQSILDFGFQSTVSQALIEQKGTDVIEQWLSHDSDYLDDDSNANQLLNFTGNHDMGRFAYMLKQSSFNYNETQQIKRNLLASAMMYFMRGVPIIYYGDEQGFVGDGGDKDSRQDMMPSLVSSYNDDNLLATTATTADDNFDKNHLFYQTFANFADSYYQYPALRTGQQQSLYHQNTAGIYAFSRTITSTEQHQNKHQNIVAFNTATTEQTVSFQVTEQAYSIVAQSIVDNQAADKNEDSKNKITIKGKTLTLTLAPLSYLILNAE